MSTKDIFEFYLCIHICMQKEYNNHSDTNPRVTRLNVQLSL